MATVTIEKANGEYRVPAKDGYEEGAYYDTDKESAISVAKKEFGEDVVIKFRSVPEFVGGKYEKMKPKNESLDEAKSQEEQARFDKAEKEVAEKMGLTLPLPKDTERTLRDKFYAQVNNKLKKSNITKVMDKLKEDKNSVLTITRKNPKTGFKETQKFTGSKSNIPSGWKLEESLLKHDRTVTESKSEMEKHKDFEYACGGYKKAEQLNNIWNNSYKSGSALDAVYGRVKSKEDVFKKKAKDAGFTDKQINMFLSL